MSYIITMKSWIHLSALLAFGCSSININHAENIQKRIDATYFGMHIHQIAHPINETPWPDVKFGTWRLWDAYVAWPNLERIKGEWNFSRLDKYVELAGQHNVDVLLPLGLSPQWASARPNEKSPYSAGNSAEPRDLEDWRNYVRIVARRYKGKIHHYELWNEVNMPMFYTGSQQKLVELAREMYSIIKEVDSTNTVISPSITGVYGKDWLNTYLQAGGGKYADVIGYHFYVATQTPEAIPSFVYEIKAIMTKNGLVNKPLWNTETGWWIANTDGTPETGIPKKWKRLPPFDASNYLARALILGKATGIDRFYWYAWDNNAMGLIEPISKINKPAAQAYGQVYDWLVGNKLNNCTHAEQVWTCDLLNSEGDISHLIWTVGQEDLVWTMPYEWHASKYQSLDGQQHAIKGATQVNITQSPMLIW